MDEKATPKRQVARWTSGDITAAEHGGFVAYGDYLTLERALAAELDRLTRENAELRADAERFEWALPILTAQGDEGDKRALRLAGAFLRGLDGRAAIDDARTAAEAKGK